MTLSRPRTGTAVEPIEKDAAVVGASYSVKALEQDPANTSFPTCFAILLSPTGMLTEHDRRFVIGANYERQVLLLSAGEALTVVRS
jgi:hypothetical protein